MSHYDETKEWYETVITDYRYPYLWILLKRLNGPMLTSRHRAIVIGDLAITVSIGHPTNGVEPLVRFVENRGMTTAQLRELNRKSRRNAALLGMARRWSREQIAKWTKIK